MTARPIREDGIWRWWYIVRAGIGGGLISINLAGLFICAIGDSFDRAFWNPKECVLWLVVGLLIMPFSEMIWN